MTFISNRDGKIRVDFNIDVEAIQQCTAYVDPSEYKEWCDVNSLDPVDLDNTQAYIMSGGTYDLGRLDDYSRGDFREFEQADIAEQLLAAANGASAARLREIAVNEATAHGSAFPRWPQDIADTHDITIEEAKQVRSLVGKTRVYL